jgi:hypothetical protein
MFDSDVVHEESQGDIEAEALEMHIEDLYESEENGLNDVE